MCELWLYVHVSGLVTLHEVKTKSGHNGINHGRRGNASFEKAAHRCAPNSGHECPEVMGREDLNQLPVVLNGHLEGIFSRRHILRLLQTRTKLWL